MPLDDAARRFGGEKGDRPWGCYMVLFEGDRCKVKRFVVLPGRRLSLQRHRWRAEHWHLVGGEALVTLDGKEIRLAAGESIDIPLGAVHRIKSTGQSPVVVIEIQSGEYLGEDDIERLEDDYGR